MQHKLFFALNHLSTKQENPNMNTTIKKLKFLKGMAGASQTFCNWLSKGIWTASLALSSNFCFAANADGYAFTGALFNIMMELKGAPIAIICAIGIIAAGFFWIFKGHDVGLKQVVAALIGGGLVIAAPTLITMVPGMTGAVI